MQKHLTDLNPASTTYDLTSKVIIWYRKFSLQVQHGYQGHACVKRSNVSSPVSYGVFEIFFLILNLLSRNGNDDDGFIANDNGDDVTDTHDDPSSYDNSDSNDVTRSYDNGSNYLNGNDVTGPHDYDNDHDHDHDGAIGEFR